MDTTKGAAVIPSVDLSETGYTASLTAQMSRMDFCQLSKEWQLSRCFLIHTHELGMSCSVEKKTSNRDRKGDESERVISCNVVV